MSELSEKSTEVGLPDAELWVPRAFDEQLESHSLHPVNFIVGESGMGKTVACQKCLEAHVEGGGFGLSVTTEVLGESRSLADAVDATLRQLHPPLAVGAGREAPSLASETTPLLVVVEDVNRSALPAALLEKLAAWGRTAQKSKEARPVARVVSGLAAHNDLVDRQCARVGQQLVHAAFLLY